MENNEPSEYEACFRSSASNNITKSELLSIFLLTVFSATDPFATVFPLANLSTSIPLTIGPSTTAHSTVFNPLINSTSD